ncbi:hypothetical protein QXH22_05030 [Mycobacterium sp. TY814]|nr:hypothetical protein [Mycobacterium sp. TY814]
MRYGILTFITDESIRPTELGPALEERGFESLAGPLEELRAVAGPDVPVTVCQWGEATAQTLEGYAPLGVERVLLGLDTAPRDQSLRQLDELAELARLT